MFEKKLKDVYSNDKTISDVVNELCCSVGKTTYGESKVNTNISFSNIIEILNDLKNTENLTIIEGMVEDLKIKDKKIFNFT